MTHSQSVAPADTQGHGLPDYDQQLTSFHRAFAPELKRMVDALPLTRAMKVLDLACGDGFYTRAIADRLGAEGSVTGVDLNLAYLDEAKRQTTRKTGSAAIDFVAASFDRLPFKDNTFDFAWCAQSLYSLPDPVLVLTHLARVLRPGGIVGILENDTIHQVFLPWPAHLEIALRAAELRAIAAQTRNPSKYYVGRRLPAVFAAAGLAPMTMATQAIDRQAPLAEAEQVLLQCYLEELEKRVAPHLEAPLLYELRQLSDARSPQHMLRQPYLTMTWLNVLALGRKTKG
ncbi:MAG: hypothetical protein NVS3B20_08260 [Polyangiales bacterium]